MWFILFFFSDSKKKAGYDEDHFKREVVDVSNKRHHYISFCGYLLMLTYLSISFEKKDLHALLWVDMATFERLSTISQTDEERGGTTVEGPPLISCYGCVSFYDSGNARLIALSPVKLAFVNWTTTMNSSHEVLS